MELLNPFTAPGRWYKANLHTHTTVSDGGLSPAETADLYRQAGYGVLALTDHNRTSDVAGLSQEDLLVLPGMEYHPLCPGRQDPHHLVAINVPPDMPFAEVFPPDANACIRAVRQAGGESILAHPMWSGHPYGAFAYLDGFVAVEVYNGTCDSVARAEGESAWTALLDAGRVVGAVGVDDTHKEADRFSGWTWLKLERLTAADVLAALRTGRCYSSTGPTINHFEVKDGVAEVSCSPAAAIYLSAHTCRGARRQGQRGRSIRKFTHPVTPDWRYVRAVVVDRRGRKAWTNPIVL